MKSKKKSVVYKYNYYDETGKRRCKSFSAPTMKEAMFRAMMWEKDHPSNKNPKSVAKAVEEYISIKAAVLSPASVRGYISMQRSRLQGLADKDIHQLTRADIQAWISDISKECSPKTVKNYWGLLRPALELQDVAIPSVTLPQAKLYQNYCPSNDDIAALIAEVRRKGDLDLLRGVYLAAFVPARRSEICALQKEDIKGNSITINKALVKQSGGGWVIKQPKEKDSYRTVVLPEFVIKELKKAPVRIVSYTPDDLYNHFRRTLQSINVPFFRFHDLRHYGASIMMYQGISSRTIELRGGWAPNSPVLRRIYQNKIEKEQERENNQINSYFNKFQF